MADPLEAAARSTRAWVRVCAILLTLAGAYFAGSVLIPLVMAVFLAILLDPFVIYWERKGRSRRPVTILTLGLFLVIVAASGWLAYAALSRGFDQMPVFAFRAQRLLVAWTGGAEWVAAPMRLLDPRHLSGQEGWRHWLFGALGSVFEVLSLAIFVPLLALYFLIEKSDLVESLNALLGPRFYLPKLNAEIPLMVRAFVRSNFFAGILLVVMHGLTFWALGLENAIGLALLSGFLNLIPLVGAPLALLVPLSQAVLQWTPAHVWSFLALIGSTFVYHLAVGNAVLPSMIGSRVNVNPASLILGLLFWGWMWGGIGFLLGIPLTAALKIVLECNPQTYTLSNLMSANPRHVLGAPSRRRAS